MSVDLAMLCLYSFYSSIGEMARENQENESLDKSEFGTETFKSLLLF